MNVTRCNMSGRHVTPALQIIIKMKKLCLIIVLTLTACASFACEICGCGGGNFYLGLLPGFKSKFVGLRYHYMNYNTQLKDDPSQFSHNYYNTAEVWGGINIGSRWQVLGFIPYHINKQTDDDGTSGNHGLGDVTLLANYQVLHTRKTSENTAGTEQQLWIGGGIKVPTGKFDANVTDPDLTIADVNAQLGTGSVDVLLNAMYNVRLGKWGINNTLSYKENTAKNTYTFGNKVSANTIGYYRITGKKVSLLPNVGLMYENTAENKLSGQKVPVTGGYIATASAGTEVSIKNMTIGATVHTPVSQNYADGQTKLKWRSAVQVTFTL